MLPPFDDAALSARHTQATKKVIASLQVYFAAGALTFERRRAGRAVLAAYEKLLSIKREWESHDAEFAAMRMSANLSKDVCDWCIAQELPPPAWAMPATPAKAPHTTTQAATLFDEAA